MADDWPAVAAEQRPWVSKLSPDQLSHRQRAIHRGSYDAAVVPPIAAAPVVIESGLAAEVDDASHSLVQFDAETGQVSAPFAAILLRSESASSSQIERLTSGARAIAEAELGERDTGNASLIVRNVRALEAALELADSIDHDSIVAMQQALLGAHAPELTGGYRTEQVWIGGSSIGPHGAAFVPPHHETVPAAMDDLLCFIRRTNIPVLTHVALAHAQFETIHPFPDGNGRTGRALVQSMLRSKGVTTRVTAPVSAGLLHDVDGYFAALTAYRAGDVRPIVAAFADAALHAVANGRRLAADISEIRSEWDDRLAGLRADATARRVADLALEHPVLNQQLVSARLGVVPMSSYRALDALVERGVLVAANSRRRNRVWIADAVVEALDAFAERAGRRRI